MATNLAVMLTAMACSGSGSQSESAATDPGTTLHLDCSRAVHGDLGKRWRAHATNIGPLSMIGVIRDDTAAPRPGRVITFHKVLVVVQAGRQVSVSIPGSLRTQASLYYATNRDAAQATKIADGVNTVSFEACPDRDTQFAGGFLVTKASPGVAIVVRSASVDEEMVSLAFGVRP